MRKILIFVLLLNCSGCKKADGKLSGVITYYFNDNLGYRPDVGSTILICQSEKIDSVKMRLLSEFLSVRTSKNIMDVLESDNKVSNSRLNVYLKVDSSRNKRHESNDPGLKEKIDKEEKEISDRQKEILSRRMTLSKYKINTKEDFSHLAEICVEFLNDIQKEINAKVFVADGNGNFSTLLPPGAYWVITKSSHRTEMNSLEIDGQIKISLVRISSDQESTANFKFEIGIEESPFLP